VTNPILWEKGVKVMLGVPLLAGDRLLGVIHVGRLVDRAFGPDDVLLLEVVAGRVAGAVQTRQLAIERAAALLLERSLLPSALPASPGLEVSARYVPAQNGTVGGDWYDVFTLPSGQLWIVTGDVAGHGIHAAVVMGRIRSALRAYTMLELPPEDVLDLVDRKVTHFEIGSIATVALAATHPPFDRLQLALAGHPPPAIAVPGSPTVLAEVDVGTPLGTGADVRRSSTALDVPPGTVLAFYTDGLVERRGESIDVGLERVRAAVTPDAPAQVARDVMRELVGDREPEDDIALVVVRRARE
jgi:serine phosphatase RsbU (regulator of sigma subunit)